MKIKRYVAKDMRTALAQVKAELGVDAVIMSNSKTAEGIEIVAAVDYATPEPQAKPAARELVNHDFGMKREVAQDKVSLGQSRPMSNPTPRAEPKTGYSSLSEVLAAGGGNSPLQSLLQRHQEQAPAQSEPVQASVQPQPVAAQPAVDNAQLQQMQADMDAIRQLLEHQVSGLMWQHMAQQEPVRAMLVDRLKDMGLDDNIADQMASFIPADMEPETAWQEALKLLSSQLRSSNNDILKQGGVVALVGPTGVGKTTTVAKLAARFAKHYGSDSLALITTDTYRIGAHEQLETYGKIIGCPVKVAKDENELAELLTLYRNKKLVLIDTAGMGQRDKRLTQQLNRLMQNSRVKIRSYLVLSATAQRRVLQEAVAHFKRVPLAGCIFTKLDESLSFGEILSVAIQSALPIGYVTNGQRVPEDMVVAEPSKLVNLAAKFLKEKGNKSFPYWQNKGNKSHSVTM